MEGTRCSFLLRNLLSAQFVKRLKHDLSLADVLHLLELLGRIFDHELEAARVVDTVLFVDQLVDSACNASPLVGRQDENL